MHIRTIVVGSLGVAVLGGMYLVLRSGEDPARVIPARSGGAGPADDAGGLRAVTQQVVALRSELVRLDERLAALPASSPAPATADAPARGSRAPDRKQAALEEQRRAVAFLDARFASEPRDPTAAADLGGELASSLTVGTGSMVRSVACGATLCRAETSHGDKQELQHFIETLSGTFHRTFQVFFERDGDAIAATTFLARDGHPMPNLAKELPRRH